MQYIETRGLSIKVMNLENENLNLKQEVEILRAVLDGAPEKKPRDCEHCKHFHQHYILIEGNYSATYDGHCVMGNIKKRKKNDACDNFELGHPDMRYRK